MKLIWLITGMLLVAACADDRKTLNTLQAAPKPAYDESWFISSGWPGEYPNGFTILKEGMVLAGRAEMNKIASKSLRCPVSHLANYNQWNQERVTANKLEFVAAAKTFPLEISADVNLPVVENENGTDTTLALKQGDLLTYLTYIAEGFALMRYQAVDYQVNEADLEDLVDFNEQRAVADDLWAKIPCANEQRGWILYAELQGMDGIGETEHTAYGVSQDLTE